MIEMQVRKKYDIDSDGINAAAHELMGSAVAAIEKIIAIAYRDQMEE